MLEVQARRFARMFSRQVNLELTERQLEEYRANWAIGKDKALADLNANALEAFLEADYQLLRAMAEGRVCIIKEGK